VFNPSHVVRDLTEDIKN